MSSKTAAEGYTLYYWESAGRAEFIRLIFEETGVPFKEVSIKTYKDMLDLRDGTLAPGYPVMAPPVIKKGDINHNQLYVFGFFGYLLTPEANVFFRGNETDDDDDDDDDDYDDYYDYGLCKQP